MIRVDVNKALKGLKDLTEQLSEKEVKRAQSRSINRAISKGVSLAASEIQKEYNITVSAVRKNTKITKSSTGRLIGTIVSFGEPLPLYYFKPKFTPGRFGTGVHVKIKKRGGAVRLHSAFIATMPNGATSVYGRGKYSSKGGSFQWRKGNKIKRKPFTKGGIRAYPDLPITKLVTTSMYSAFTNKAVMINIERGIKDTYAQRLEHELKFMISKRKL